MATQPKHNGSMLMAVRHSTPSLKRMAPQTLAKKVYHSFLLAVAIGSVWTAGRGIYQLSGFQTNASDLAVESSADGWAELKGDKL